MIQIMVQEVAHIQPGSRSWRVVENYYLIHTLLYYPPKKHLNVCDNCMSYSYYIIYIIIKAGLLLERSYIIF
jgi:hypothetical protein